MRFRHSTPALSQAAGRTPGSESLSVVSLLLAVSAFAAGPAPEESRPAHEADGPPLPPPVAAYRATLHSHTQYSDGGALRHVDTRRPLTAYQAGRRAGLDAMAVTDHAEQLSEREWDESLSDALAAATPEFAALRGFEWTHTFARGTFARGLLRKIPHPTYLDRGAGHLTVIGSRERVGAYPREISADDVRGTLGAFYRWLADPDRTAIDGGSLVAQFNHPTTFDNISHFDDFALPAGEPGERLREVCALMELGSVVAERYEGGAQAGRPLSSVRHNEYWFRHALARGWRVAPTNSEDNHGGYYGEGMARDPGRGSRRVYPRTGIYARRLTPEAILDALRRRRVFASEDRHATLRLMALPDGEPEWRWMGEALEQPDSGTGLTLHVSAEGRDRIRSAEIIGPGDRAFPLETPAPPGLKLETTLRLSAGELDSLPRSERGELYFYARVFQKDGDVLYSAPVWLR